MKTCSPRVTFFVLIVDALLLLLISTAVEGFVAAGNLPVVVSSKVSSSMRYNTAEEESEWYTPPPKPKSTAHKQLVVPVETIVVSPEDLRSFLQNQEDGRLAIVTYHASWCRSCARFNLHLNKLKATYADLAGNTSDTTAAKKGRVRFASVEWGANTLLCQDQSVSKLPTTRLYYQNRLVKEFTKGAPEITRVQDAIKYYVSKQEKDMKEREFEKTLDKGANLVSKVLTKRVEAEEQHELLKPK